MINSVTKLKESNFAIFDQPTFGNDCDKTAAPKSTKLGMFVDLPIQYDFTLNLLEKLNAYLLQLWSKSIYGVFATLGFSPIVESGRNWIFGQFVVLKTSAIFYRKVNNFSQHAENCMIQIT